MKYISFAHDCTTLDYYAGWISRDFAEAMLRLNGEFLVRRSQSENGKSNFVLSLRHMQHFHHYVIKQKNSMYYIQDICKKTLADVIQYYLVSQRPVAADNATLKTLFARPSYFYPDSKLEISSKIGEGSFGKVYLGHLNTESSKIKCAVKVFDAKDDRVETAKQKRSKFFEEAEMMFRLRHPNVISVHCILVDTLPLRLVLEYAPGGSLYDFLRRTTCKNISRRLLCSFCGDAAEALRYLASKKVIHGDIAARNCLIDAENKLKIADFGLSSYGRQAVSVTELVRTPTKWLAPEVFIKGYITPETDIWAYGVLLWEIWSKCRSDPYPGLNSDESIREILLSSPPMQPPVDMPELYSNLMVRCFNKEPSKRPTPFELVFYCNSAVAYYFGND